MREWAPFGELKMNDFKDGDNIWSIDISLKLNQIHKVFNDGEYCSLVFSSNNHGNDGPFYLDKCSKSKIEAINKAIKQLEMMKNG